MKKNVLRTGAMIVLATAMAAAQVGCNGGGSTGGGSTGGGSTGGGSTGGGSTGGGSTGGGSTGGGSTGGGSTGGGSTGGGSTGGGSTDPYYTAWHDVYGYQCANATPLPGCNFYSDGVHISAGADPYYAYSRLDYGTWQYTDVYGYNKAFTGYAWLSSTGILYDANGYALNEDEGNSSRDLMGDVAIKEKDTVEKAGKAFAEKYALAEAKGIQVAQTLNDWATLGKKHGRTDQDIADFSQRLFGIKMDRAVNALAQMQMGDDRALASVNDEVASFWGTNPETSKEILMSWYRGQLGEVLGH